MVQVIWAPLLALVISILAPLTPAHNQITISDTAEEVALVEEDQSGRSGENGNDTEIALNANELSEHNTTDENSSELSGNRFTELKEKWKRMDWWMTIRLILLFELMASPILLFGIVLRPYEDEKELYSSRRKPKI